MAKTKKNKSLRGRKKRGGTKGTRTSKLNNNFKSDAVFDVLRDVIKKTKPEYITRHTLSVAVQRNNPEFVQLLVDKMSKENKRSNLNVSLCSNNKAIMNILENGGVIDALERGKCTMNDKDTRALATQHAFNKLKETGKINEHVPLDVLPEMREYMTSRWDR